jgi:hypothetical protein
LDNLKLAQEIRKLLNSANQAFSNQIKKDKNTSDNYKNIAALYLIIIKHLDLSSDLSYQFPLEFELFKLEATFGLLKCEINSLQLCPVKDADIQKNESQLVSYSLRIQQFLINLSVWS